MFKYAIVPTPGRYSSGATVRPIFRCKTLSEAQRKAAKMTRAFQKAMRPHGGTSGGYRVVGLCEQDQSWLGHDLDREPTVGSDHGELRDYSTGQYIRMATPEEVEASTRASRRDGGPGVILIDADGRLLRPEDRGADHARRCYVVQEEPEVTAELDIPLDLDNDIVGVAYRIIDFDANNRAHVRGVYRAADLPVEVQAVIAASPDSTAWTLPNGFVVELVGG